MSERLDLSGVWRCGYWFPSNTRVGDEESVYDMQAHTEEDTVVFESLPNEERSSMQVRLTIEDDVATGSWHEVTSPTGEFKGARYSGYGQLIVDYATESMEGKWVGMGYDRKLNAKRIYNGLWTISRQEA